MDPEVTVLRDSGFHKLKLYWRHLEYFVFLVFAIPSPCNSFPPQIRILGCAGWISTISAGIDQVITLVCY